MSYGQSTDSKMAERLLDAELAARSFELGWQRTDGQVSCLLSACHGRVGVNRPYSG